MQGLCAVFIPIRGSGCTVLIARRSTTWKICAGFVTALLSDKAQLNQLATSLNTALELAQEAGLNLAAIASRLEDGQLPGLTAQVRAHQELTQQLLSLPAGSSAVVTNGRAVVVNSPALELSDDLTKEDFALLVGPVL